MEATTVLAIMIAVLFIAFLGFMVWVKEETKDIKKDIHIQSNSLYRKIYDTHQKLCKHKEKLDITSITGAKNVFICADCGKQFIEDKIKHPNELEKYIAEQLVKDVIKDMENLYSDDKPPKPPKGRVKNESKKKKKNIGKKVIIQHIGDDGFLLKEYTGTIILSDIITNNPHINSDD